jgi:hypothetical protein
LGAGVDSRVFAASSYCKVYQIRGQMGIEDEGENTLLILEDGKEFLNYARIPQD